MRYNRWEKSPDWMGAKTKDAWALMVNSFFIWCWIYVKIFYENAAMLFAILFQTAILQMNAWIIFDWLMNLVLRFDLRNSENDTYSKKLFQIFFGSFWNCFLECEGPVLVTSILLRPFWYEARIEVQWLPFENRQNPLYVVNKHFKKAWQIIKVLQQLNSLGSNLPHIGAFKWGTV